MATFDDVRTLAVDLPGAEEATSYGTPALKVRKKLFARLREEGDVLVVRVDRDERGALIESEPDVYFVTPHYENYGYVLVRLEVVERDHLREILTDAWWLAAPKKLCPPGGRGSEPFPRRGAAKLRRSPELRDELAD